MSNIKGISETCQDLFAYYAHNIINTNTTGYWVDFGARNWGDGFGQNNTVLLYENGWSGLSLDIGDFKDTYSDLDKNRVHFERIDCTLVDDVCILFKKVNVPKVVDYLNFDIDEATESGLFTLEALMDSGYQFNVTTIEHDSYRFGTRVRDLQREMLTKRGYILAAELDMYEDWWIHRSVYVDKFDKLRPISEIKHQGGFNQESLNKLEQYIKQLAQ